MDSFGNPTFANRPIVFLFSFWYEYCSFRKILANTRLSSCATRAYEKYGSLKTRRQPPMAEAAHARAHITGDRLFDE
jgi:hypothetical protein